MRASGSSSTWSRASTSSSTPDEPPAPASRPNLRTASARLIASFRLVHPFPSILDGVATAVIALLAGGGVTVALRLGVAMVALQFAIGAFNDIVDAPRDAGRKPGKPIPAGLVSPGAARMVVGTGVFVGLGLSAMSGALVLTVAALGCAAGFLYDLRLKGTPWAWMAFAIGIPLLPVYAWLGAAGTLPVDFIVLVPTASVAGAAIAVGNGLVDVDRDRASRTLTPAVVLGPRRAWRTLVSLHAIVGVIVLASIPLLGGSGPGFAVAALGVAVTGVGVAVARSADAAVRERGWQLQAIGLATTAIGWVLAVADVGG